MVPPVNLSLLERGVKEKEFSRRLYLLSEGTLTEPQFLEKLITGSPYFKNNTNLRFYRVERSGNDFGINKLSGMIDLAKKTIISDSKKFTKSRDKILVFFDLDIYHNSINKIKKIIEQNRNYFIFIFTNPAIELFLLLCKENSYEECVRKNLDKILENDYNKNTHRRFIHQLVVDNFQIDPKKSDSDFSAFSNGLSFAINQEKMYMEQKLINVNERLISNFGYILEKIKNNNFEEIEYFSLLDDAN